MALRLSAPAGDAPTLTSPPASDMAHAAPLSTAAKGKKREAPLAPLARDSPAAAPMKKKPPPPRPVRKAGRSAAAAPPPPAPAPLPRETRSFVSGAGFIVLQECLHTHPDAVPVVGHGQFPPSAPYYIVRIRVCDPAFIFDPC